MKLNRTLGLALLATATVGAGAALAAGAATTPPETGPATSAATAPAHAGRHWHHHGGMLVGMMLHATRQLNLTADQQTQIKGILTAARSQHQASAAAGSAMPDMSVLANPGDPNYA